MKAQELKNGPARKNPVASPLPTASFDFLGGRTGDDGAVERFSSKSLDLWQTTGLPMSVQRSVSESYSSR